MGRKKVVYDGKPVVGYIPQQAYDIVNGIKKNSVWYKHKDKLFYILIFISSRFILNKNLKQKDGVAVSSVVLKKIIPVYKPYLDYLVSNGVIYITANYSARKFSRKYSFQKSFFKNWSYVKITGSKICRNVERCKQEQNVKIEEDYNYLCRWFNKKLTFHDPNFNSEQYPAGDAAQNEIHSFWTRKKMVEQDFSLTIDASSGRLHTPLTNLKKDFRKYLRYDGRKLCGVDISNSQPYFLLYLISCYENGVEKSHLMDITKRSSTNLLRLVKSALGSYYHTKDTGSGVCGGESDFIADVTNGNLYSEFGGLLGTVEKKAVKEQIFKLFFTNEHYLTGKVKLSAQSFKKRWPEVGRFLAEVKAKKHNTLALILQSIERYFVLDIIAREYSEQYPDNCLFSIHDSLITFSDEVEVLKLFMEKRLAELTGFKPTVVIEDKYWQ
jgi:hypothetical protein